MMGMIFNGIIYIIVILKNVKCPNMMLLRTKLLKLPHSVQITSRANSIPKPHIKHKIKNQYNTSYAVYCNAFNGLKKLIGCHRSGE